MTIMDGGVMLPLEQWGAKLKVKEFSKFTKEEQKQIKEAYKMASAYAGTYTKGTKCVVQLKAFEDIVRDMEGFFFETVYGEEAEQA